eukprot:Sspe_Gene.20855::Locus_7698_Transcript_1_2_Confidence_0.800_Length_1706::g.20855::m.20855
MSLLTLPTGIQPIWLEGVITSEYERDTLPLLFSPDDIFNEYYDVLTAKNEHISNGLYQIRTRNIKARKQRAEGYWQECLESLAQCLHLRRCIFDDDDFQYMAAVKHYVLSVLNFASFFVKESRQTLNPAARNGILSKGFELFKQAEEATQQVEVPHEREFFRAVVASNFANYYFRRKRVKAACQQVTRALKHWKRARVSQGTSFMIARDAITLCFTEKWEEACKALHHAVTAAQVAEEEEGAGKDDQANLPIRFNTQLLFNPIPIAEAMPLVLHHNLSVAYIGARKYKEAMQWCQSAMEAANASSQYLGPNHPWVAAIRNCQTFCTKIGSSSQFQRFRMKPSDMRVAEFQKMQQIINETRTMPIFNSLLQLHRKQRAEKLEAMRREEEAQREYERELRAKAASNTQTARDAAVYVGGAHPPPARARTAPARKPLSALKVYMSETAYRDYVQECNVKKERKRVGGAELLAIEDAKAGRTSSDYEDPGTGRSTTSTQRGEAPMDSARSLSGTQRSHGTEDRASVSAESNRNEEGRNNENEEKAKDSDNDNEKEEEEK